jgi:hypothetical protein
MVGKLKRVYLSSILILCGVCFSLDATARDNEFSYACEKQGDTRYLAVVRDAEFACRVKYTKASGSSFPWNAQNEASYCRPKAAGLLEKLRTSGWECDSTEDVKAILLAQIERYNRHIKILNNAGKNCNFYPSEAQFGNLCGDARDEAVIVYTCDAKADSWQQHLAVFHEIEVEPIIKEIGGSDYRQVSEYYIDNGKLIIEAEKVGSAADSKPAHYPVENTSIQCLYSAEYKWELIEKK